MPIEHTRSFGRLIIKEAFTAMKKTSLSSYRNHALFALLALLFAACVFCLGCNSGSDSQQTPAPASATPAPTAVPTATPVPMDREDFSESDALPKDDPVPGVPARG